MTSQLKHVILLNIFIANYSGIRKFSFGILLITIYRFTLYMQGDGELCNTYFNIEISSLIARHIKHVTSLI